MKISMLILLGQTEDKLQVMYDFNSRETNSSENYLNYAFQTKVTHTQAPFWLKNWKILISS